MNQHKHSYYILGTRAIIVVGMMLGGMYCSGCKKNAPAPTQTASTESVWQLDANYYRSDKILLNGYVSNDSFTVAGFNSISIVDSTSLSPSLKVLVELESMINKPVCSGSYWVYHGTNGAQYVFLSPFYARGDMTESQPFFWRIILHDLDTSYSPKAAAYPNFYSNPIGAFNNQGQFLSAVLDTGGASSFCIIEMNASYTPTSGRLLSNFSPKLTKITLQGNDQYINYVALIASYKDRFFVSAGNGNYIVYPNGTYRMLSQVNGYLSDVFTYHDTLYTLTYFSDLFRSVDDGENWTLFASDFPSGEAKSFHIGNEIYFYVYSQIFRADFTTGVVKELENSGLETNEITSINQYGDKVWVTTLSGMFYTSIDDFLTYKPTTELSKSNNRLMTKKIIVRK